jgi:peptidoglycan endopeptidase LytE
MEPPTPHIRRIRRLALFVAILGLATTVPATPAAATRHRVTMATEGPPAEPAQVHIVRKGDTLGGISRSYGVSQNELRRINSLKNGNRLRPGTRIVLREELPETYVVRKGDTLAKIGRRFGLAPAELAERNELDSDALAPGRELTLRDPTGGPGAFVEARGPTEEELEEAARPMPADGVDSTAESLKSRVLRVAQKMLSIPYRWGGTTLRGIDCSAYVRMVFGFLDLELPRTAREQFRVGETVDRSRLSIGDLVFFRTYAKYPSHVGIYLGDNRFIHASSGSREVRISSLDKPYYVRRFIGAKRLLFQRSDPEN